MVGQNTLHAAAVKIVDHLLQAGDAAGHVARQIVLVAIVDADVRIDGPDQHAVDAAVALFQIVEIAVDRVLAGDRIVEVAILDHHLRLHEVALRPLQLGAIVLGVVVADADQLLVPPVE